MSKVNAKAAMSSGMVHRATSRWPVAMVMVGVMATGLAGGGLVIGAGSLPSGVDHLETQWDTGAERPLLVCDLAALDARCAEHLEAQVNGPRIVRHDLGVGEEGGLR